MFFLFIAAWRCRTVRQLEEASEFVHRTPRRGDLWQLVVNACRQGSKWETALTILAEMSQEYVRLLLGMKLDLRELSKDRETKFPAVFLQEWRNTCLNLLALCNRVRFQTPCSAALEHT